MPSLDYDLQKARFHADYTQNLPLLENALESFVTLLSTLVAPSRHMDGAKVEGRIKSADECVRKFSRKYRAVLEEKKHSLCHLSLHHRPDRAAHRLFI